MPEHRVHPGHQKAQAKQPSAVAVIPARLASTRFPGKVLAAETGKPLVQHVVEQVRRCRRVNEVIVAADDPRIAQALARLGTRVVMTSPEHQSGTDRVAEVAKSLAAPIILNVQGDEPEIEPDAIDAMVELMQHKASIEMATVVTPFYAGLDPDNPNLVKAVVSQDGRAIYFSRSRVPYQRERGEGVRPVLHIGLYGYRRDFLLKFAAYPPSPLEQTEKLEQLRALEYGHAVWAVVVAGCRSHGIDTPEQYAQFIERYRAQTAGGAGNKSSPR